MKTGGFVQASQRLGSKMLSVVQYDTEHDIRAIVT